MIYETSIQSISWGNLKIKDRGPVRPIGQDSHIYRVQTFKNRYLWESSELYSNFGYSLISVYFWCIHYFSLRCMA